MVRSSRAYSFDDGQQVITRSANDNAYGHPGFGYVVSHNTQTGNSPLGKANAPSNEEQIIFSSGHHAIHRVEFGFEPYLRSEAEETAWRAIRPDLKST